MNRVGVKSSNIKSIGHDSATNTLEVEFNNGGVYQYHDFTSGHYGSFTGAQILGSHFHANIKNNFKFSKIK